LSSLREKLKALEELQQVDLEMNEVRARIEGLPARRAEIDAARMEVRRAYDDEKSRLDGLERERRGIEQLLQLERDKVKKWEGRLGEIKTPREYAALSREIDIAKKANEGSSEQLKELGNQAADIRGALEAREEAIAEREEAAQGQLQALEKDTAELQDRMAALEKRRAEASTVVDPSLLGKYENIRRRRAGVAIAPVVGMSCNGCHRNIPPQLAIILQRANSIEICPNCNRIIYSAEALNPPAPSPA
jgi:predicted  nucleic acid-binding Zn-ribbon protein